MGGKSGWIIRSRDRRERRVDSGEDVEASAAVAVEDAAALVDVVEDAAAALG